MASILFDAFMSHNSRDKDAVRLISQGLARRGVNVWFDEEHVLAGDVVLNSLQEALLASRAIVVCVGPNGFSQYHSAEMDAALAASIESGRRVIPVFLPGGPKPNDGALPVFLRTRRWVQFETNANDAKRLDDLARSILSDRPAQAQGAAPAPLPSPGDSAGSSPVFQNAIDRLVSSARAARSLTFFLASGYPPGDPDLPPRPYEIATQLLTDIAIITGSYEALLPPLDAVSSYYGVSEGQVGLENRVKGLIADRSRKVSTLHAALAEAMARIGGLLEANRRPRQASVPQLIVTTGLDLMCERALLRAGISFTRIVQHWTGKQVTINRYADVKRVGDTMTMTGSEGDSLAVGRDDFDSLDNAIASCGLRVIRDGASVREGQPPQSIRQLDFSQFQEPYLYKYHGSYDLPNSCALSTEHYLRLAASAAVPERIVELIGNSAALFLVSGALDRDVAHAYHTLLRRAYQLGDEGLPRFAVVRPPEDPERDRYRRLETRMWASAKDAVRESMGIAVIEGDAETFLSELSTRAALAPSAR